MALFGRDAAGGVWVRVQTGVVFQVSPPPYGVDRTSKCWFNGFLTALENAAGRGGHFERSEKSLKLFY